MGRLPGLWQQAPHRRPIRSGHAGPGPHAPGAPPRRPADDPPELAGVTGNFWIGLALLHALFMLEHNAICDRLTEYPTSMTTSCTTTAGSSTLPSWPGSTPSSGRRHCSPTRS